MTNLEKLQKIFILIFIGTLIWGGTELSLLLRLYRQQSTSVLQDIQSASKSISISAQSFQQVSESQRKLLESDSTQRSIGLLLRTGDDLNRTVKKLNVAIDGFNESLRLVNSETLPKINTTIDNTNTLIFQCSDGIRIIINSSDSTIQELKFLLQSEQVKAALQGMADTSINTALLTKELEITSVEFRELIKEFLTALKIVADNSGQATAEVTMLLQRINKPLTKKEKALNILVRVLTAAGPSIVESLRR